MAETSPKKQRAADGEARLVWDFTTLTGSVDGADELLRLACTGLPRLVPGQLVALARSSREEARGAETTLDDDAWVLARCAEGGEWREEPVPSSVARFLSGVERMGTAIRAGTRGMERDAPEVLDEDERVVERALERLGLRRLLLVPLVAAGDHFGLLVVGRERDHDFSAREVEHVSRAAEHLALHLARISRISKGQMED